MLFKPLVVLGYTFAVQLNSPQSLTSKLSAQIFILADHTFVSAYDNDAHMYHFLS